MAITVESPPIAPDEALALLEISPDHTSTGRRNRALISLLWRLGMRPGEALSVSPGDIDLDERCVRVNGRIVGMDDLAAVEIARWAERREEMGLGSEGPFVSTLRGKPLSQAYVRELLPRPGARVGLAHRVHAMAFRYACAAEMAVEGITTEIIEAQLGVRPQSTVARYLRIPEGDDIIGAIVARPVPGSR